MKYILLFLPIFLFSSHVDFGKHGFEYEIKERSFLLDIEEGVKEISQEERKLILEACMQAPSAGNQQMYTIIDVQDKKLQETLSKTCDNQPFINQAKMVLIFCADFQKWYDLFNHESCNPRKPGVGAMSLR